MLRDDRMAALSVPGRQVLLLFALGKSAHPSQSPAGTIPSHDAHGIQHLCFAITLEDLPAWEARLTEHGLTIESRLVWPQGATSLYFRDPDGHSLELSTPRLWPNDPG
jgi:catechol 2,3-dioxygenase-like lactoylglutathione lyase family enzyme